MLSTNPIKTALTIAGSDPSGGAGIQADLKTFSHLRVYGMAVIAALTAQNTVGVSAVQEVDAGFVGRQLEAVLSDIPPDATKTGMLLTSAVIEIVVEKVKRFKIANLVVDPVMMSTSGATLLNHDAVTVFRQALLPLAELVTPNADEATALAGVPVRTGDDMREAARRIHGMGPKYVLIKGGHVGGNEATDVLFDGSAFAEFRSERLPHRQPHGTGCVLAASIVAYLALGKPMQPAIALGKEFVTGAIKNALNVGKGRGPCDPLSLGG